MEGRWCLILLLAMLLMRGSICLMPEFSHGKNSMRVRSEDHIADVSSFSWGKLRKRAGSGMNSSLETCRDWVDHNLLNTRKQFEFTEALSESSGSPGVSFISSSDLMSGDVILEFPIERCMNDNRDDDSLDGLPWELKLAGNLLLEAARGPASERASYIACLPRYVHLPMFFTEMELQNVEDKYVLDKIQSMRQFAVDSYKVLRGARLGYAKFADFAWALSIVYSLSFKPEGEDDSHFLLPFPRVITSHNNVKITADGGILNLSTHGDLKNGSSLSFFRDDSITDAFLFQGRLLEDGSDEVKLFSDVEDIADWFFSQYSGVNSNRFLTLKLGNEAAQKFRKVAETQQESFSIGSNGEVHSSLRCILASLAFAREAIELHNKNSGGLSPLEFDDPDASTWQEKLKLIAEKRSESDEILSAFSLADEAIIKRVSELLALHSTDLIEDELLLRAARFEGLETSTDDSSCPTCRWQIEKQSWSDLLATGFRASKKRVLQRFLSGKRFNSEIVSGKRAVERGKTEIRKLKRFSTWCENHNLSISEKLSMTFISDSSYQQKLVRGVLVTKDIEEGETLCTLALDAGLYDNSVESNTVKDSWDLAALRLLEEKALGSESEWADYINILPREMASPFYLRSEELEEVQWLPVIRELIQAKSSIRKSYSSSQSTHSLLESFKEYEWAVIMVHSRAFTLPVLPNNKFSHYVLMPFMDMINHHFVYQADWMSQPVIDRKLEIIANKPLKKGDQLFASFGPRSNDNLFLYYGFVLENNPFDTAQVFESFEDALSWFIQAWTTRCREEDSRSSSTRCTRGVFRSTWPSVKHAIDEFEGGSSGQSKDWWELVSKWADYGYQYLPYQPGPTIYSSGISDPSLLAAFSQASSLIIELPEVNQIKNTNQTFRLQQFFGCLRREEGSPISRPLLDESHRCREHLVSVLSSSGNERERDEMIAKISVAARCLEILASFPTTIEEDLELLKARSRNPSIQLAREFRYMKKLLLEAVVLRLLR